MGCVRQHYLNLFKAESQREKSEFHEFRRENKKKKVLHNFFYFSQNLPKFTNLRAQALRQTIFFLA